MFVANACKVRGDIDCRRDPPDIRASENLTAHNIQRADTVSRSDQTSSVKDRSAAGTIHEAMHELAKLPAIHAAMEKAHGRVIGFQLITPTMTNEVANEELTSTIQTSRSDAAPMPDRRSLGQIPPLPRPKFLSALANFAMGE